MGWSGVDVIRRYPGETKRDAIARVYAGGVEFLFDDSEPIFRTIPGNPRDHRVARDDRRFMLDAIGIIHKIAPMLQVIEEEREPGRRWPWHLTLAGDQGPYVALIAADYVTLRPPVNDDGTRPEGKAVWDGWWTTVTPNREARLHRLRTGRGRDRRDVVVEA
jgi:hypothetical protein